MLHYILFIVFIQYSVQFCKIKTLLNCLHVKCFKVIECTFKDQTILALIQWSC